MAKKQTAKSPGVYPAEDVAKMFELDFKNRALAALLAWLWPGAGHLYQGRTAKGLLFMLCIVSTFVFGFWLGAGKVAYATPLTMAEIAQQNSGNFLRHRLTQAIDRWPFFCQAGIGVVALPAVIERQRFLDDKEAMFPGAAFYPPKMTPTEKDEFAAKDRSGNIVNHPSELAKWNYELGFRFELGTIYTVIAGLLNILVVYDAYSGPLVPRPPAKTDENDKDGDEQSNSK